MSSKHDHITCDGCSTRAFRLRRFKCLICFDYDLCGNCYDLKIESQKHSATHPMQCLLTKPDQELFYQGEKPTSYSVQSFTCPYCNQSGLTESAFVRHIDQKHPVDKSTPQVICPLCMTASPPDPNRQVTNLLEHLKTRHKLKPTSSPGGRQSPASVRAVLQAPRQQQQSRSLASQLCVPPLLENQSSDCSSTRNNSTSTRSIVQFDSDSEDSSNATSSQPSSAHSQTRSIDDAEQPRTSTDKAKVPSCSTSSTTEDQHRASTVVTSGLRFPKIDISDTSLSEKESDDSTLVDDKKMLNFQLFLDQLIWQSLNLSGACENST